MALHPMKNLQPLLLICIIASFQVTAQDFRWQQRVDYSMNVHLDVKSNLLLGTQRLVYTNNSPDTLRKIYYHLYFNAFQPGSMMDVRSRSLPDPDKRVLDRISKLTESEIGYQHILSLRQDGKELTTTTKGTILEVKLAKPMLPHTKSVFEMKFEAQVPIQIRRSGRNNKEGIAYSITQWYPKVAEYDFQGWHAYQYVAREFHGVWGDFDVNITIDPTYVIAGTGILQNPEAIGHGYEKPGTIIKRPVGDLTWHFVAKDVIDFAWVADPEFTHDRAQVPNGPELHFFYQKNPKTVETWPNMEGTAVKTFEYLNSHFGKYPYASYSIIQGGDGGMEYPMCTLILGEGTLKGLTGVMAHEVSHSWYQATLASNESLYPWMDEGSADFASHEALASIQGTENPHAGSYASYFALVASGLQEPASQAGDHFNTNKAYGTVAYSMGTVFLNQMKYLIGNENFYKGMKLYYNMWQKKHPEPNDFIRVMEKVSDLQLHWYLRYWVNTTKRIDYGIDSVTENGGQAMVTLKRFGEFPMPVDLLVTYKDGTRELNYISMNELMGGKPNEDSSTPRIDAPTWAWVATSYDLRLSKSIEEITSIEIDPSQRMADINRKNNVWKPVEKAAGSK
jgi:hypothetical protein